MTESYQYIDPHALFVTVGHDSAAFARLAQKFLDTAPQMMERLRDPRRQFRRP